MKKVILGLVTALAFGTVQANDEYIIAAGKAGYAYDKSAKAFTQLIPGGKVKNTAGTGEILKLVKSGEVQFGIVQMDGLAQLLTNDPAAAESIDVLGPLFKECVYMAARVKGLEDSNGLQVKGSTVAVGKDGSGSRITWKYMGQLEPKYKNSAISKLSGTRALAKLLSGSVSGDNKIDAVMWVGKPDVNDKLMKRVLANDKLRMIPVNDWDLNDTHPVLKKPIYTLEPMVTVEGSFSDDKVKTICTTATIIFNSDTSEELIEAASDAMLDNLATLVK